MGQKAQPAVTGVEVERAPHAHLHRWGELGADVSRGLALRHDWGPQYRSAHFLGSLRWPGIADDAAFVGELRSATLCRGRWIKTLKEQCLWARLYEDVEDLRQAVRIFVETYNHQWLIQRHGHQTPREKYLASFTIEAA